MSVRLSASATQFKIIFFSLGFMAPAITYSVDQPKNPILVNINYSRLRAQGETFFRIFFFWNEKISFFGTQMRFESLKHYKLLTSLTKTELSNLCPKVKNPLKKKRWPKIWCLEKIFRIFKIKRFVQLLTKTGIFVLNLSEQIGICLDLIEKYTSPNS